MRLTNFHGQSDGDSSGIIEYVKKFEPRLLLRVFPREQPKRVQLLKIHFKRCRIRTKWTFRIPLHWFSLLAHFSANRARLELDATESCFCVLKYDWIEKTENWYIYIWLNFRVQRLQRSANFECRKWFYNMNNYNRLAVKNMLWLRLVVTTLRFFFSRLSLNFHANQPVITVAA
jgi:hypothetical protein